jgi:hypothetical protein
VDEVADNVFGKDVPQQAFGFFGPLQIPFEKLLVCSTGSLATHVASLRGDVT